MGWTQRNLGGIMHIFRESIMRNSRIAKGVFAGIAGLIISTTASFADAPDKKNKLSGEEVWKLYAGKTWAWSKGGSYWAADGSFEAIWENSVGVGKWYATSTGKLCHESSWKEKATDDPADVKRCWLHVRDSDGGLWKQDLKSKEWYKAKKEFDERVKSGHSLKSKVKKLRKKVDL